MADWYQTNLVDTGRSAALWAIVGFLVTYAATRWITLRIRARKASGSDGQTARSRTSGLIGLPIPTLGLVGAIRVAKPSSYWAKRFYAEEKMAKATRRFAKHDERRERLRRLFGAGRVEPPDPVPAAAERDLS